MSISSNNVPVVRILGGFLALVITTILLVIAPLGEAAKENRQEVKSANAQAEVKSPADAALSGGGSCSTDVINIPDYGAANPYPSTIQIAGRSGYVTNVMVSLNGLTHEFYPDLDMLLVGPEEQGVVLMSDAGGDCHGTTDLTIQDGAPAIPNNDCPRSGGTYRPTNYGPDDSFPAPAPDPYYDANLDAFNGSIPNGTWSLYVVDDYGILSGQITGGWCLDITTSEATPATTRTSTLTRTSTVTNTPTYVTPPPVPTATATGGGLYPCFSDVVQSAAYCLPGDTYHYRFVFDVNPACLYFSDLTASVYLDAAPDVGGPWTNISQRAIFQSLTPDHHNLVEGDITEAIPQQYLWFRYRLSGYTGVIHHPVSGQTEPMYICGRSPLCPPSWNELAPYPTLITGNAIATNNSSLYSFGGRQPNFTITADSYRYDTATNTWSPIAPLPDARWGASATNFGNSIIVLNGLAGPVSNSSFIYNPATNSYTAGPTGLLHTTFQSAVALDGHLYRIGGAPDTGGETNTVEIYGERYVAPLPQALYNTMAVAFRGYIYVAGGVSSSQGSAKTYRYDPASDTWSDSAIADLPLPRSGAASGILNDKWILAGGMIQGETSAIAWDPATNTWNSITPMLYGRNITTGGSIGDAFYTVGGTYHDALTMETQQYLPINCEPSTPTATSATFTATPIGTLTITPSATATTPANSSSTPHASTTAPATVATAQTPGTQTPTVCAITFTDVPSDSAFYAYIRCLVCRGIISGYSDGTFRPNSDITRGQIAKIVSNAAGFSDDPGAQIYEDVPTGSPFYIWINRLSSRGYMGGYVCGLVPDEPCIDPAHLPYFRPNASATRGQLSKIVSNAAGLSDTPTDQFYADVPQGHPFYLWVMRLTTLGVMSGYTCGGPGEACDDQSRPYFRPYSNVTRGQASKIIANTFLSDCQTPQR